MRLNDILTCRYSRDGSVGVWTMLRTRRFVSNRVRGKKCVFSPKTCRLALGNTQLPSQWVPGFFRGLKLTAHLHLMSRLGTAAAALCTLHVVVQWAQTALPFTDMRRFTTGICSEKCVLGDFVAVRTS